MHSLRSTSSTSSLRSVHETTPSSTSENTRSPRYSIGPGGGYDLEDPATGGESGTKTEVTMKSPLFRLALSEHSQIALNISRELPSTSLQMLEFYNLLVQISKTDSHIDMPELGAGGIGALFQAVDDDHSRTVDKDEVIRYLKKEGWWAKMVDNSDPNPERARLSKLDDAWVVVSSHTVEDMKVVLSGPSLQYDDGSVEISVKGLFVQNELAKTKATEESHGRVRDIPYLLRIPHQDHDIGKPIRVLFNPYSNITVGQPPDQAQSAQNDQEQQRKQGRPLDLWDGRCGVLVSIPSISVDWDHETIATVLWSASSDPETTTGTGAEQSYDDVADADLIAMVPDVLVVRIEDEVEIDFSSGTEHREYDRRHSLVTMRCSGDGVWGQMKNKEAEEVHIGTQIEKIEAKEKEIIAMETAIDAAEEANATRQSFDGTDTEAIQSMRERLQQLVIEAEHLETETNCALQSEEWSRKRNTAVHIVKRNWGWVRETQIDLGSTVIGRKVPHANVAWGAEGFVHMVDAPGVTIVQTASSARLICVKPDIVPYPTQAHIKVVLRGCTNCGNPDDPTNVDSELFENAMREQGLRNRHGLLGEFENMSGKEALLGGRDHEAPCRSPFLSRTLIR